MRRVVLCSFALFGLAACSGSGGGGGAGPINLPLTGNGKLLAARLPATVSTSVNAQTGLPQHNIDSINGATPSDQSSPGGMAFAVTGTADANPAPNFGNQSFGTATLRAAEVSASTTDTLAGGTTLSGMTNAKGRVYFENGNFGDPQVETATAAVSTVSVYNPPTGTQIVLTDVTTIRYREGAAGSGAAVFGVGYVGNPTATMPSTGVTYRSFFEQGSAVYDNGTGPKQMYMKGDAARSANMATGKVTGGVSNASLNRSTSGGEINLNSNIAALEVDGTITGNTYSGTALFKDGTGATIGTQTSEMTGGFFGAGAKNTALALQSTGTMQLEGANAAFTFQGVMGGAE